MDLLQKNQPFAEKIASQFVGGRLRTCTMMLANLLNGRLCPLPKSELPQVA